MFPESLAIKRESYKRTRQKLDLTEDDIKKKLDQGWVKDDSFVPLKKVKPDQEKLVSEATSLQGVTRTNVSSRYYPYGEKQPI